MSYNIATLLEAAEYLERRERGLIGHLFSFSRLFFPFRFSLYLSLHLSFDFIFSSFFSSLFIF